MAYTTINNSRNYFEPKNWTGDGSASRNITGINFQPDWTWIKQRNGTAWHNLYDSVRGATKDIYSNATDSEGTNINRLTSFDSNGFSIGSDSDVNGNGFQYISWNWKAGTTSGQATNSYSTITPTSISFNQTSGFSIIKYTGNATAGAGVPHGLGAAPKMVMTKNLDSSSYGWYCYHASLGATKNLYLHTSDAEVTSNDRWNGWLPDATNVSLGTNTGTNGTNNMIMYCFAEIPGFSKFSSYTGNGNADGIFVYTGFKPAFLITKVTSTTGDWEMVDWKRASSVNPINKDLRPNNSDSETTSNFVDFYSNGFKIRTTGSNWNSNGEKYVYMCFAQAPLVGSNNVPCTAR